MREDAATPVELPHRRVPPLPRAVAGHQYRPIGRRREAKSGVSGMGTF